MNDKPILVAEDDENIRLGLVDTLESEGYHVVQARDGIEALDLFSPGAFRLVLLDIMMPGKSGYDVCREIRARDAQVPLIMVTAKSEEIDTVVGLQLGADDYITKPFGVHELLARIAAVLRRAGRVKAPEPPESGGTFVFGGRKVDPLRFTISRGTLSLDLSLRELKIIQCFCRHPGEVLGRDRLLNEVWGIDYFGTTRTLDQHIAQLRKKVETDPANPAIITTVHGVGYRYRG
ncbi:MAG: response regulator transcription factor [Pseudomonadota bacterium]